jgi:hypothetical protein
MSKSVPMKLPFYQEPPGGTTQKTPFFKAAEEFGALHHMRILILNNCVSKFLSQQLFIL